MAERDEEKKGSGENEDAETSNPGAPAEVSGEGGSNGAPTGEGEDTSVAATSGAEAASQGGGDEPSGKASGSKASGAKRAEVDVARRRAQEEAASPIYVHPHAEGLFYAESPAEDVEGLIEEIDEKYAEQKKSRITLGVIGVVAVALIAGVTWIQTDSDKRKQVQAFLNGTIVEYKTARVRELKKKWAKLDQRAQNEYGNATLRYFPKDAEVDVTRTKEVQNGEAWRKQQGQWEKVDEKPTLVARVRWHPEKPPLGPLATEEQKKAAEKAEKAEEKAAEEKADEEKADEEAEGDSGGGDGPDTDPMKAGAGGSDSDGSDEGEGDDEDAEKKQKGKPDIESDEYRITENTRVITLERGDKGVKDLPLTNLPIFETVRGDDGRVKKAYRYQYELKFDRKGYESQSKTVRRDDWKKVGPGNMALGWKGLDLSPKPETVKANFSTVMKQFFCLMKEHEDITTIKKLFDEKKLKDRVKTVLMRNGFKDQKSFMTAYNSLTRGKHEEWWKKEQKKIAEKGCED